MRANKAVTLREQPNVWRQWRAQRVHCTLGLGTTGPLWQA